VRLFASGEEFSIRRDRRRDGFQHADFKIADLIREQRLDRLLAE
jgi:hypothetical protein